MLNMQLLLFFVFGSFHGNVGQGISFVFDHERFDRRMFAFSGQNAEQFVSVHPRGLRIRVPGNQLKLAPVGVAARFGVSGDFEITATFEIQQIPKSRDEYGAGATIYIATKSKAEDAATVGWFTRPKERIVYSTHRATTDPQGKRQHEVHFSSAKNRSGKLRLSRRGETLHYAVADGEGADFQELRQVKLGTDDLSVVRLAVHSDGARGGLDVLWKDLSIRAERLPGLPGEAAAWWPWVMLGAGLTVMIPIFLWWRRSAGKPAVPRSG
jgi:hypothetical protein